MFFQQFRFLAVIFGFLEGQPPGGLLHPFGITPYHLPAAALEQPHGFGYAFIIFLLGNQARTRGLAFSRMVIEARAQGLGPYAFLGEPVPAVPQGEKVFEQLYQAAGMAHRTVRPEIRTVGLYEPARKENPRKILVCHANPRIGLGILEKDVVLGLVLLYQIVFQKQGIGLAVHHGMLQIRYFRHHQCCLASKPVGRHKILGHPVFQGLRLSDIYHLACRIVETVDPGSVRQQFYPLSYIHFFIIFAANTKTYLRA